MSLILLLLSANLWASNAQFTINHQHNGHNSWGVKISNTGFNIYSKQHKHLTKPAYQRHTKIKRYGKRKVKFHHKKKHFKINQYETLQNLNQRIRYLQNKLYRHDHKEKWKILNKLATLKKQRALVKNHKFITVAYHKEGLNN